MGKSLIPSLFLIALVLMIWIGNVYHLFIKKNRSHTIPVAVIGLILVMIIANFVQKAGG